MQYAADIEDIVQLATVNGSTKFDEYDIDECIEGMKAHIAHNGVQLDGFRRLSQLCSPENSAPLLLSETALSIMLSSLQKYYFDNRVGALSLLVIGTALRNITWDSPPEGIDKLWKQTANTTIAIMGFHKTSPAILTYGCYLLSAIIQQPEAATYLLGRKQFLDTLHLALENCDEDLLIVNYLFIVQTLKKSSWESVETHPAITLLENKLGCKIDNESLSKLISDYSNKL